MSSPINNRLNFSGGPGVLPESVLLQAQEALGAVPEVGLSVLGISHRSDWFAEVVAEAENNVRALLNLPDDYAVLFLQGGATLQFSMVPMLMLRGTGKTAEYLRTGYWSGKAIPEARLEGNINVLWDGENQGFHRLPDADELHHSPDAAYLHYVSNETVEGIQFHQLPGLEEVPRVCDMSSDFLSRPIDPRRYQIIYAHAQKNLGPAGVALVIINKALLEQVPPGLPGLLDYRSHIRANSIYNTPPVFAIYVTMLVTRWLLNDMGGLHNMAQLNCAKAELLYSTIDQSAGFYRGWAREQDRSLMNVVFNLSTPELERSFLASAEREGFSGLKGHRSLGGLRASIYNAMTLEATGELCEFMREFLRRSAA